jgi:hypothetical protein
MANRLHLFLAPEDELQLLRFLEKYRLEVYPRRVPKDWKTFHAGPDVHAHLPDEDVYLAAADIGPVLVDSVKRGPDKGSWRVDEVRSPVIFWERSTVDEDGAMLSGQLWAELDVTPQTGRQNSAPDRFRKVFMEVEEYLKKSCRKSEPIGFLIGPHAARRYKEGLVLKDREPPKQRKKGNVVSDGTVRPFR